MDTSREAATAVDRRSVLRGSGLATLGGVLWFATILLLPNLRQTYETEEMALAALQDHRLEVFVGWSMLAMGDLLIGVGFWLIAKQVAAGESGWQSTLARGAGHVFLVAAIGSALIRIWPPNLFASAEELAANTDQVWWTLLVLAVWVGMSLSFIGIAVAITGSVEWPRGLGIALVVLGVLTLILFLPLFYWIGAIAVGVVALRLPREA